MTFNKTHIHWFRNDLRLADQFWTQHLNSVENYFGLYIIDPIAIAHTRYGFRKMGLLRLQWLRETLIDLQDAHRKCGSELIVLVGCPSEILLRFQKEYQCSVSYTKEITAEEKDQEKACAKVLQSFFGFDGNGMFVQSDLPFPLEKLPHSFTSFRTKIESARIAPYHCLNAPEKLPPSPISSTKIKKSKRSLHPDSAVPFFGGESAAMNRVSEYIHHKQSIRHYKATRNELLGTEFSTKFSLWLANGSIHVNRIVHEIKQHEAAFGASDHTYWVWFELMWREFFRWQFVLQGNAFFKKGGLQNAPKTTSDKPFNFEIWKLGKTKERFVDANMRELLATGFQSNRGRQNVASYLIHEMDCDWRMGAAWFEHILLDYDVCSNYGNWSYIAGVGNDPRGGRAFNIRKQAEQYDSNKTYVKTWLF